MIHGKKALRTEVKIGQRGKRKLSKDVVSVETTFTRFPWGGLELEALEQEAVSVLSRKNHTLGHKKS